MDTIDMDCGLCYNRPSYSSNPFSAKEVFFSCSDYLCSDVLQTLQTVNSTDVVSSTLVFCEICHGSINQLALFVDQLKCIQNNIAQLAAKINQDVVIQRNIHQKKKVSTEKLFPTRSQNLNKEIDSNVPTKEKFSTPESEEINNTNVEFDTADNFDDQLDSCNSFVQSNKSVEADEGATLKSADILTHMKKAESGFKCENCSRTFSRLTILKSHDCARETCDCDICGFSFSGPSVLKLHISRTHSGEKPFKCDECGKTFGFKHHLAGHIRTHTGEKPFECSECDKKYSDQSELVKHKKKHQNIKFTCEICDKSYAHRAGLRDHLQSHVDSTKFKCDICHKTFVNATRLRRHRLSVHSNEKLYSCEHCGKLFKSAVGFNKHILRHTTSEKNFACEICPKVYSFESDLTQHKKLIHSKLETIICDVCGKTSTSQQKHKTHMQIHSMDYAKDCQICGKKYKNNSSLSYHIRVAHKNEKPRKCELCEESFTNNRSLRLHKLREHSTVIDKNKLFVCEICKKPFDSNLVLVNHQLMLHHVTSAAFVECQSCSEKFANLGKYEWHNIRKPLITQQLRCRPCEVENNILTFANYCEFFAHLKDVHDDLVPSRYKCEYCGFVMPVTHIKSHTVCDKRDNPVSERKLTSSLRRKGRAGKSSKTSKPVIEKTKSYDLRKIKTGQKPMKRKYCDSSAESEENEYSSDQQEGNNDFYEGQDEDFEIKEEIESSCDSFDDDVKVKIETITGL